MNLLVQQDFLVQKCKKIYCANNAQQIVNHVLIYQLIVCLAITGFIFNKLIALINVLLNVIHHIMLVNLVAYNAIQNV